MSIIIIDSSPHPAFKCTYPQCDKFFNRHDNLLQHLKVHKQILANRFADSTDDAQPPRHKPHHPHHHPSDSTSSHGSFSDHYTSTLGPHPSSYVTSTATPYGSTSDSNGFSTNMAVSSLRTDMAVSSLRTDMAVSSLRTEMSKSPPPTNPMNPGQMLSHGGPPPGYEQMHPSYMSPLGPPQQMLGHPVMTEHTWQG